MTSDSDHADRSRKQELEAQDRKAVLNVEQIFSSWRDLKEKVRCAASLCDFVASRIEPHQCVLNVPDDVARRFESVCLWIRKILPDLAPEVREQALKLLDDTKAESTIAILHLLGDEYRWRLMIRQSSNFLYFLGTGFGLFKSGLSDATVEMLRAERLQETRVALRRLSGMLDYAADDLDEVENYDDVLYRKHYNPQQVDRVRVLTLLQGLKAQLDQLPKNDVQRRLVGNVEELTKEADRPNPRWRSFLGKALILLAIVADIKTVHPEIGDEILDTIDVVIRTIVAGCQVKQEQLPVKHPPNGPRHWAMEPKRIELRSRNETEDNDAE